MKVSRALTNFCFYKSCQNTDKHRFVSVQLSVSLLDNPDNVVGVLFFRNVLYLNFIGIQFNTITNGKEDGEIVYCIKTVSSFKTPDSILILPKPT